MTAEKLRFAQSLMADRDRSIPEICRELGDLPTSTLYHYLHADGTLKHPGLRLLMSPGLQDHKHGNRFRGGAPVPLRESRHR